MSYSYKDYFEKRDKDIPKPQYEYGDRVFSYYKSVPLVGMVIRETEEMVLVHSDLPIAVDGEIRSIVSVPVKKTKRLVDMS
jgi:hypothetical protein